ncbi:MAG: hypothetical protein ACLQIQ_10985 [Beijerinckiaceae bacterium]
MCPFDAACRSDRVSRACGAVDVDAFPTFRILRDEHSCHWSREADMWVLSRYDDILRALNDWSTYSSATGNPMTELPNRANATLGTTECRDFQPLSHPNRRSNSTARNGVRRLTG